MDDAHEIPAGPEAQARIVETIRRLGLVEEVDVPRVAELVRRSAEIGDGVDEPTLAALVQAYGRAVDRIAGAGADIGFRQLASVPPERLDAAIADWLTAIRPLARDSFSLLHERRLDAFLRRRLAVAPPHEDAEVPARSALAIALVDLRGSTAFMLDRPAEEIERLVDDLYNVSGEVAARHRVAAGKFLGDGALLLSPERELTMGAARDAVALLGERTPLRAAAGVAYGPVVRRAGDWFGTPVNLAARLAELAPADEVFVDEAALPRGTSPRERRTVRPRGLGEARRVAVF